MKINELIKENIEKYGAQSFFDSLTNSWYEWSDKVKESLLNEVYSRIKPEKIETIEDVAKLLHNNIRGDELCHNLDIDLEELCKENRWVILFPYSDDNLEIRGYIDDEIGCYGGKMFKFVKKGDFYEDDEQENTYHKAQSDTLMSTYYDNDSDIKCEWLDNDYYVWCYEVLNDKLPREYFDIQPDDEDEHKVWARCCVIDLNPLYD